MRSFNPIALVAMFLSFGTVALDAGTAEAAPCCSAPMCQQDPPSPFCNICRDCSVEEEVLASVEEEPMYDETAGICYASAEPELSPNEADNASERAPSGGCE